MPPRDDKRLMRKLKRVVKRAGSKHRRHELKDQLRDNPTEAHWAEESYGRHESKPMNAADSPRRE